MQPVRGFPTGAVTLQGTTVRLRALGMGDSVALAAAAAESRDRFGWTTVPEGVEGAEAYITQALQQRTAGERLPLAVEFRDRVVGSTSFYAPEHWRWPAGVSPFDSALDAVAIGYTWLGASAQRTRCNTEAKQLMLAYAFDQWGVQRVTFHTDARNLASRAAIERIGGKLDGVMRAHVPSTDGGIRDSAVYSILRSEWPSARDALRARLDAHV